MRAADHRLGDGFAIGARRWIARVVVRPMTDETEFDTFERESADLRRRFRVMTIWQAYRACARLWFGSLFMQWGCSLLAPHLTPSGQWQMHCAVNRMAADFDVANEGLCEARDSREREVERFLGIED